MSHSHLFYNISLTLPLQVHVIGIRIGNQTFRTIDFSYRRRFVPFVDFSYTMDDSHHGLFVPSTVVGILYGDKRKRRQK